MTISWEGVFPAATTQFAPDFSVDHDATGRVQDALIHDGVHGLIVMGTVGENNSLEPNEKRAVLKAAVERDQLIHGFQGNAPVLPLHRQLQANHLERARPHEHQPLGKLVAPDQRRGFTQARRTFDLHLPHPTRGNLRE